MDRVKVECVDLGVTTPPYEECAQVGTEEYLDRARKEARALIAQLRRVIGPEPPGAQLRIRSHEHDFGRYLTTVVEYDPSDSVAAAYAWSCDEKLPEEWDEQARTELALPQT
jgi:hypothetical protein